MVAARAYNHISRCKRRGIRATVTGAMCGFFASSDFSVSLKINKLQFGFGIAINKSSLIATMLIFQEYLFAL